MPTSTPLTIPHDLLAQAALCVHALLTRHGLAHVFLGGFELALLGFDRGSKDIDVEVEKPFFKGFEKVRDAFKADPSFAVFDGNRHDGIRAIWRKSVGIDILMRPGRFSKTPIPLSVTLPPNPNGPFLPFLSHTNLLIEKIKCAGERNKSIDAHDVVYLLRALAHTIDLRKVRKGVTEEDFRYAVAHHPSLAGIFDSVWVAA